MQTVNKHSHVGPIFFYVRLINNRSQLSTEPHLLCNKSTNEQNNNAIFFCINRVFYFFFIISLEEKICGKQHLLSFALAIVRRQSDNV